MLPTARAYATHLLTASGAVSGLLALLAAARADWPTTFAWLGVAFVVDAVDGPLSRRYDAPVRAPIIDGALLDLVVDYLTYVFVPLFALLEAGFLLGPLGSGVALAVAFAGLALDAAGFVEGAADQPPSVAAALTWLFGPGVGAAFVLTACVLWRYRFDERKQAQARAILARRAAGRRAVTPASAR
jgi:phosphatidylglycerophosphate synthase